MHEPMTPQHIMQPSTVRASKQSYSKCSTPTYHHPSSYAEPSVHTNH